MDISELKDLFPRFDVDTFEHVLGHVSKAAGKLHGLVGDADHIGEGARMRAGAQPEHTHFGEVYVSTCPGCKAPPPEPIEPVDRRTAFALAEKTNSKPASVYIADLAICAAVLAARCPSGEIDLKQAILDRMAEKKDYLKQYR